MKKIRSIEDYFIEKFNEAQDKIEELKAENDYLKEKLGQIPAQTDPTEAVVLPELAVRYSINFYRHDIDNNNKDEWAKAVESNDFEEITIMYRAENSYNDMIRQQICNAIIKVVNTTFYGNVYISNNEKNIVIYDNWLRWFETEEEAQEEVRRLIRERLDELEKEDAE